MNVAVEHATKALEHVRPLIEQAIYTLLNEPAHLIVEGVLLIFVLYLLLKRSYVIPKNAAAPLTQAEKDALVRDWEPAPLIDEKQRQAVVEANLGSDDAAPMLVAHSSAGPYVSLEEGVEPDHLNFISTGYLNYQDDPEMIKAAEDCMHHCGVGACGPRGFYGTVDVHLNLEKRMAEFFDSEEAVLYSSGFATISSVIPAFAKSSDYLFVDKGVSFAPQLGVTLARSKTFYFEHNDIADLEKLCKQHAKVFDEKVHRVFVLIEGIYVNHADIAPLDKILALKQQYHFRIIADESHSVGVLGKTGRGLTEHFGVPTSSIEILSGSIGNAIGAIGGFSVGPKEATSHQRLSSSAYVFSCSLPPYIAASAIAAFDRVEAGVELKQLQARNKDFDKALKSIKHLVVVHAPGVPLAHLRLAKSTGSRLEDDKLLQRIVDQVRTDKKVLVARTTHVFSEKNLPPPSIRVAICVKHTAKDLEKGLAAIDAVAKSILGDNTSGQINIVDESDEEDVEEVVRATPVSPKATKAALGSPTSKKAGAKAAASKGGAKQRKGKN